MIRFYELYDCSTQTFNFYEFEDYRLFVIDINSLSGRAYCFVVHGEVVDYFITDIWQKDVEFFDWTVSNNDKLSVQYLYWSDRMNDKIIEFRANMRISHPL